jgi:hypothetical protein
VPRLATARSSEENQIARELLPNSARGPSSAPRVPQQSFSSRLSLPIPQSRCDGQSQQKVQVVNFSVGLLSSAVVLRHQQKSMRGPQLASSALSEVGAALGVRQSELTLYEVRQIQDPLQLSPTASNLAVAVKNSGGLQKQVSNNAHVNFLACWTMDAILLCTSFGGCSVIL